MNKDIYKEVKPKVLLKKVFSPDSFSIEHVSSTLQLSKEEAKNVKNKWESFLEMAKNKGAKPWDGTYYRLENIKNISENTNKLNLSTIKYSQVRGLTHDTDLSMLSKQSQPNHVSAGSFIQTADGYFIFGLRNSKTVHSQAMDFIGGGVQAEEKEVNKGEDLFASVKKEMEEEAGITDEHINSIVGVGILLSIKFNVILMFYTKLNKTKEQVVEIFKQRKDDEMDDLVFVKANELETYLEDKGSYRAIAHGLIEDLI